MSEQPVSPVQVPGVLVGEVPHAAPASVGPDVAVSPTPPSVPAVPYPASAPETPAPTATETPALAAPETAAPAAPESVEVKAEKKPPAQRGGGMAAGGAPIDSLPAAPDRPGWPGALSPDEDYVPDEEFDATDLAEVNRELNRARARIFRCSQVLKRVQRAQAEAQVDYDRAMRRALVSISGGTSESRRAMAEIKCEEFENRVVIGKQVVEEWKKRCTDARDDLKAVENISHNVRAQIDIR